MSTPLWKSIFYLDLLGFYQACSSCFRTPHYILASCVLSIKFWSSWTCSLRSSLIRTVSFQTHFPGHLFFLFKAKTQSQVNKQLKLQTTSRAGKVGCRSQILSRRGKRPGSWVSQEQWLPMHFPVMAWEVSKFPTILRSTDGNQSSSNSEKLILPLGVSIQLGDPEEAFDLHFYHSLQVWLK